MTKIKPMTLERLKELIEFWRGNDFHHEDFEMALGWIEAEARARYWEMDRHTKHTPALDDLIVTVKKEVGWSGDK